MYGCNISSLSIGWSIYYTYLGCVLSRRINVRMMMMPEPETDLKGDDDDDDDDDDALYCR